jgi:hypothetical protein
VTNAATISPNCSYQPLFIGLFPRGSGDLAGLANFRQGVAFLIERLTAKLPGGIAPYPNVGNQSIIVGVISLGYLLAEAALFASPSTLDDLDIAEQNLRRSSK